MTPVEKVEEQLKGKEIPDIMYDENGKAWAIHGLINSSFAIAYKEGKRDMVYDIQKALRISCGD